MGEIELAFTFNADLIASLKTEIPTRHRQWDPVDKVWRVSAPYLQAAVDLLVGHFPRATIPEGYTRPAPVAVTDEGRN